MLKQLNFFHCKWQTKHKQKYICHLDMSIDHGIYFPITVNCDVENVSNGVIRMAKNQQEFPNNISGFNSSLPEQNGCHFADVIFKCIYKDDNWILIQIPLQFVPNNPIDNKRALVQIMAWRRTGDKPVFETMLTQFIDAYMRH